MPVAAKKPTTFAILDQSGLTLEEGIPATLMGKALKSVSELGFKTMGELSGRALLFFHKGHAAKLPEMDVLSRQEGGVRSRLQVSPNIVLVVTQYPATIQLENGPAIKVDRNGHSTLTASPQAPRKDKSAPGMKM